MERREGIPTTGGKGSLPFWSVKAIGGDVGVAVDERL